MSPRRPAGVTTHDAARTARARAAEAFLECDETELAARSMADALAELEPERAAAVHAEVEAACGPAYAAAVTWIETLDAHQHVLDDAAATTAATVNATQQFVRAREVLVDATRRAQRYRDRHAEVGDRVRRATEHRDRAVRAVTDALDAARQAVAGLGTAGGSGSALLTALTDAETQAAACRSAGLGIGPGALSACTRATQAAEAVRSAAQRWANARSEVPQRLASLQTRLQGTQSRAESIPTTLSSLRIRYSASCSAGLERAEEQVLAALGTAGRRLQQARCAAEREDWELAMDQIEAVRSALGLAEATLSATTERLTALDEVRADPRRALDQVRFRVRDAQRLVVAAGQAATTEIPALDALVVRLDRAWSALAVVHPDFWAYLQEIEVISDAAQQVVARTRAAIARRA